MDYNDELIGIIDKVRTNADTKATHDNNRSSVPPSSSSTSSVAVDKYNLIDFNDCQYEHIQSTESTESTESTTSSSTMAFEEISKQNVRIFYFFQFFPLKWIESVVIGF